MQPWVTNRPTAQGLFVPWIAYRGRVRSMRYFPMGLSGDPAGIMSSVHPLSWILSFLIDSGMTQTGLGVFPRILNLALGVGQSSRPRPTGRVITRRLLIFSSSGGKE